nr:PD-(D/E)XK nuclease family protein [Micromonospora sp. DSM 115978]
MTLPAIGFALPLDSENRWSDLLAMLVATDPRPLCELAGTDVDDPEKLLVRREVAIGSGNRLDIVVEHDGKPLIVIEVKVLAGLGRNQLKRYREAEPTAEAYLVVYPQRLVVDVAAAAPWRGLSWEEILGAYAGSTNAWVATCATAWLSHLDKSLPKVAANTGWDQLDAGENFILAMRARMSWIHGQLDPPSPIEHDMIGSAKGVSWVVRLLTDAHVEGYRVLVEVEERLPVQNFPKHADKSWQQPFGPSIKVCLLQRNVKTSATFNWDYLLAMWPVMQKSRPDWVPNAPRPKAEHDIDGYRRMVDAGGPRFLGIGFGEAQAKMSGACMFGAKVHLAPTVKLYEVVKTLEDMYQLIVEMAAVAPPNTVHQATDA